MTALASVPTLDTVATTPDVVRGLSRDVLLALSLQAVNVQAACMAALLAAPSEAARHVEDRLLRVKEVAERLGRSPDWICRHLDELPFAIRQSGQRPRFSMQGLERYIRSRTAEPFAGRKGRP